MKSLFGELFEGLDTLRDNRFGWRFKIANLIMGDLLRNYLAVGVRLPLDNAKRYYKDEEFCKDEIDKAIETIDEIFEM